MSLIAPQSIDCENSRHFYLPHRQVWVHAKDRN